MRARCPRQTANPFHSFGELDWRRTLAPPLTTVHAITSQSITIGISHERHKPSAHTTAQQCNALTSNPPPVDPWPNEINSEPLCGFRGTQSKRQSCSHRLLFGVAQKAPKQRARSTLNEDFTEIFECVIKRKTGERWSAPRLGAGGDGGWQLSLRCTRRCRRGPHSSARSCPRPTQIPALSQRGR